MPTDSLRANDLFERAKNSLDNEWSWQDIESRLTELRSKSEQFMAKINAHV